jgi:hypothetical protein
VEIGRAAACAPRMHSNVQVADHKDEDLENYLDVAAAVVVATHASGVPAALRACCHERLQQLRFAATKSGAAYWEMQQWRSFNPYAGPGVFEGSFQGLEVWPQRTFPGGILQGLPQGSGPPACSDPAATSGAGRAVAASAPGATSPGVLSQPPQQGCNLAGTSADATANIASACSAAQADNADSSARAPTALKAGAKKGRRKSKHRGNVPRVDTSNLGLRRAELPARRWQGVSCSSRRLPAHPLRR